MTMDWTTVFTDSTCASQHEFVKHLKDGSVWCPDCGEIVEPDTFNRDLPGVLDDVDEPMDEEGGR